MKPGASALLCAVGLALVGVAAAQEPEPKPEQEAAGATAQSASTSAPAESASAPTKDIFDVLRALLHKPPPPPPGPEDYKKWMIAGSPVINYGPTSGFGLGVAGNVAFYKGFPATTRISSLVASVIGTTKNQLLVNAKLNASALDNRWRLEGDNRLYWTSQKTYGLGTDTQQSDAVDQKYDYFRFYETIYRQLGHNTYLGAGFLYNTHTDVRPTDDAASEAWAGSPYVAYSEQHGFDAASQTSAGFSLHALLDSRDSSINPCGGWYAGAAYRLFFKGFLGGTSDWQQLSYDVRTYLRLSRNARHKLAFWLSGDFVTGGTAPYLDLPGTGMDTYGRAGRGYPQGRFRGEGLVYGELEYRWTLTKNGLIGTVAFLNTETLSNESTGEKLFRSFATAGGVGLRVMLNKRSQTNLCFDIGFGKDGSNLYFAVQEAF
jgi:hypothetical protein